ALAGTVGGGGLGDVAIRYGYERFNKEIMIQTVVILLVLVQLVQILGNLFYTWAKNSKTLYILATLIALFVISIIININNDESFVWQAIILIVLALCFIYKFLKK
ncbi:TPA: ABC transporter permease, partial [Campylobacter coli]|nr:ABC transporter permease [Campylobacter coli]